MLDHRDFGELVGDKKQVRKNGNVLAAKPVKNFDRLFDFDTARNEQKRSRRNKRLMQPSKFRRTERRFGRHEIFSEKLGVLDHGALERLKDHAPFLELIG